MPRKGARDLAKEQYGVRVPSERKVALVIIGPFSETVVCEQENA
jgi:hypothetical protein